MSFQMKSQVIAVYSHDYFTLAELRKLSNDSFDYFWWACYHDEVKEQYCYIVQVSNMIRAMALRPSCHRLPAILVAGMDLIHRRWCGKKILKTEFVYEYATEYAYGLKTLEMAKHSSTIVDKINNVVGRDVVSIWSVDLDYTFSAFGAKRFDDAWIMNEGFAPL